MPPKNIATNSCAFVDIKTVIGLFDVLEGESLKVSANDPILYDFTAPLAASYAAGRPLEETPYTPSFVDGIGAPAIWPEMWHLAQQLLDGSLVVGLEEIADAIRLLAERNSIIAEGAGAASVAAALAGKAGDGKVVCIVSGGNIDASKLVKIFQGKVP